MKKGIYLFLVSLFIISVQSCNSDEQTAQSADNKTYPDSLEIYFPPLDFTDKIHIHHWAWGDAGTSLFKGNLIPHSWLKKHLTNDVFKLEEDEDYYGIFYIKELNSLLIRNRVSLADHMQQTFLLAYDKEKGVTHIKKVASYFGAEGFINQSASWIIRSDSTIEMMMRNNNWSIKPDIGETSTDSIRVYRFENNIFAKQSTKGTTSALKKQFPFLDD